MTFKIRTLFIALLLAMIAPSAFATDLIPLVPAKKNDGIIRILAIGNSFSEDAIEQYFYELAAADGQKIIVGNLYYPGCSLERHANNVKNNIPDYKYRKIVDGVKTETPETTIATALADESWDYVSVQQASHFSGKQATYEPYMSEVLDFVRKHVRTDTKIMFHMTWAYSKDSNHGAFPDYGKDQMRMYNEIIAATQAADKIAKFDIIIPSGTAIQNARTSKLGDTLNRDGYHLQLTYGRYTAACTWYEAIFGKTVIGNSYAPSTMSELEKYIAQEAAHAAVLKPYSITDLSQISQICVPALEWSGILAEY